MGLSILVKEHQVAIKQIIAENKGYNPRELAGLAELQQLLGTVKIFVDIDPNAEWENLAAMETELTELLNSNVFIYANLNAVPQRVIEQACPI